MFRLTAQNIDIDELRSQLANPKAGAFCSFEGWVRISNEGRQVKQLEYEAYPALVLKEADKIILEAKSQFPILELLCVHRTGLLQIGDLAVYVAVTAEHRDGAFSACRYLIDQIKLRLAIWKQEYYADGSQQWVNCSAHHDRLAVKK